MIEGDIQALTRRAMDSVLAILEAGGMTASNIVKTNIISQIWETLWR